MFFKNEIFLEFSCFRYFFGLLVELFYCELCEGRGQIRSAGIWSVVKILWIQLNTTTKIRGKKKEPKKFAAPAPQKIVIGKTVDEYFILGIKIKMWISAFEENTPPFFPIPN